MAGRRQSPGPDQATYIISVAAELAGVHPQTLRVYERRGLVAPHRTAGNTRRYSARDIERLRRIQELTEEGINLAGVMRIMELETELLRAKDRLDRALVALEEAEQRIEMMSARTGVSLVPLKDIRRIRRVLKTELIDEATRRRVFAAGPIRPIGDEQG